MRVNEESMSVQRTDATTGVLVAVCHPERSRRIHTFYMPPLRGSDFSRIIFYKHIAPNGAGKHIRSENGCYKNFVPMCPRLRRAGLVGGLLFVRPSTPLRATCSVQSVLMVFFTNQKSNFTIMNHNHQISLLKIKKVPAYRVYLPNYMFLQSQAKPSTG